MKILKVSPLVSVTQITLKANAAASKCFVKIIFKSSRNTTIVQDVIVYSQPFCF